MLIIFLGPPGSGKGTQAKIVAKAINLPHISTGDMLRAVAESSSELGITLRETLGQGKLVSNDIVNKIVAQTIEDQALHDGCIIDGFPRSISQARFLEGLTDEDYKVIYLKIDSDFLKSRIEGRFSCTSCKAIYNKYFLNPKKENICDTCGGTEFDYRSDDNISALLARLKEYEAETMPLIDYYQKSEKLIVINANDDVSRVNKEILDAIKKR